MLLSQLYLGTVVSDITGLWPIFKPLVSLPAKSIIISLGFSGWDFTISVFLVSALINVLFPLPVQPITIIAVFSFSLIKPLPSTMSLFNFYILIYLFVFYSV